MENLLFETLEASIANPNDEYEVDLIADAASVGTTDMLFDSDKKIEWTEEMLQSAAESLAGMPINLREPDEEGKIEPHSNVVIGRVAEAVYDRSRQKLLAKGKLWKHYFPDTIEKLNKLHSENKAQVSIEFQPTEADYPEDGVIRPKAGRFIGLGVVNKGADRGNFIHLLASAREEDAKKKLDDSHRKGVPLVGSYEWIGENAINHLNASSTADNYVNRDIVATYPDRLIWSTNGTFYQLPYTISQGNITFGGTIEVEQDFRPIEAAINPDGNTPNEPQKEAVKPMADITDTELEALKASATKAETLGQELETLRASLSEVEGKLEAAEKERDELKSREEEAKLEKLAASRMEEVEKIQKYEEAEERTEALETFKTMDEKSFNFLKKALQAAAATKGGVEEGTRIRNPFESNQDPDGQAAEFIGSDEYKRLVAGASVTKENA
jgi:hypothetical protein